MCFWRRKTNPYQLDNDALVKKAEAAGIYIDDVRRGEAGLVGPELRRRLIEFDRSKREHRVCVLALCSAIVSLISAIGAWVAVCK